MPLPLIPLLMAAANVAPVLMKFVNAGPAAEKVAQQVADVATVVSGITDPEQALKNIALDPVKRQEFELQVMDRMKDWDEMFLADLADARKRDTALRQAGQRNHRADTMYVLAVIVIALVFYVIWTDQNINEFMKGISTLILGRFLGYLDQIYSFEFGTTRSSKNKDATIDKLTGGK